MTETNPPGWLQNAGNTHTAAQLRTYLAGLQAGTYSSATTLRARGGVHPDQGLQLSVTQTGSPSMAVLVNAGTASIPGTEASTQGNYFVTNDAAVTLSVTAAHATLPRIDIVVFTVRDSQYSGASNDSLLQVIAGTPASSPVAPSAPNNSIILAQIAVAAAVTTIVDANITDTRTYLAATGGVMQARTFASFPTSTEIGESQLLWDQAANELFVFNGTSYKQLYPIMEQPSCKAYQSTLQTLTTATTTAVVLQSEAWDLGLGTAMHDNVTNNSRVVAPETGIYLVTGMISYAPNATGRREITIRKNAAGNPASGTRLIAVFDDASAATHMSHASFEVSLTASDYIEMFAFQSSGANLNTAPGEDLVFLSLRKVREAT